MAILHLEVEGLEMISFPIRNGFFAYLKNGIFPYLSRLATKNLRSRKRARATSVHYIRSETNRKKKRRKKICRSVRVYKKLPNTVKKFCKHQPKIKQIFQHVVNMSILKRGTHDFEMIKIREGKGGCSIQNPTSAVDGAQKRRFERILNCNFRDHKFLRNSKVPQGAPKVRPRCLKVRSGAL